MPSESSLPSPALSSFPYRRIHLAPRGFEHVLREELADRGRVAEHGRLFCCEDDGDAVWAQNTWLEPRLTEVASIGQAVKVLKSQQHPRTPWACFSQSHHRRCALIQEQLRPRLPGGPLRFGDPAPSPGPGAWTLLDQGLLLASPVCTSPFPHGEAAFVEDRTGPPSRAYLKLWEALTLAGRRPGPGELCLDLGASPGGWTWVLAGLGCRVVAVDKAPLEPRLAALPTVETRRASAFSLDPRSRLLDVDPDWICCDVICYPSRLLAYVRRWLERGRPRNFVCTLKFQGPVDFQVIKEFQELGGRLVHLSHNRHELTWIRLHNQGETEAVAEGQENC